MKTAICHYSLRRRYKAEQWSIERLVKEVKGLGVEGVDFHAGLMGATGGAADAINAALGKHRFAISGLSLGNNFNQEDPEKFKAQVDTVCGWLEVAAEVKAPVCRIFGGAMPREHGGDEAATAAARQRVMDGLGQVVKDAERLGLILAIENHGGLPCTGEEQVEVIKEIGSPSLRATIDVGNYMQGGQEGHVGTAVAAPYAAYVHFKDFRKIEDASSPLGYKLEATAIGEGDVDLPACVRALRKAGYDGTVALEYEAAEDETTGVPRSVENMNKAIAAAG